MYAFCLTKGKKISLGIILNYIPVQIAFSKALFYLSRVFHWTQTWRDAYVKSFCGEMHLRTAT